MKKKVTESTRFRSAENGGSDYRVRITFSEPGMLYYLEKVFYNHLTSPEFEFDDELTQEKFKAFYEKFKRHYKALDKS